MELEDLWRGVCEQRLFFPLVPLPSQPSRATPSFLDTVTTDFFPLFCYDFLTTLCLSHFCCASPVQVCPCCVSVLALRFPCLVSLGEVYCSHLYLNSTPVSCLIYQPLLSFWIGGKCSQLCSDVLLSCCPVEEREEKGTSDCISQYWWENKHDYLHLFKIFKKL